MVTSHMRGAVSYHRGATGLSWKKWDGKEFTRDNLGEDSEHFNDVTGEPLPNGEHPSIQWNRQTLVIKFTKYMVCISDFFNNG